MTAMQDTQNIRPFSLTIRFGYWNIEQLLAERVNGYYGSLERVAERDLDRYYKLLADALPAFSKEEGFLLVDALSGTLTAPYSAQFLWSDIEEVINLDNLAEDWDVDGQALVKRLRALTPFESMAVCDACERFWSCTSAGIEAGEALRRVGLLRD